MSETYDIIIIGSGAGGGTIAQELAGTGKKILILERGEHLPVEDDNWSAEAVFIDKKYRTTEKWYDKKGKEFSPNIHYWVGGNTAFYGGVLMRFREGDFERREHAGGTSPKWPISYAELAPYYERAEEIWEVRGERGTDPSEPPYENFYKHGALEHEPEIERLTDHLRDNFGLKPFKLPLGVRRNEVDPASAPCIRCTTCGGFPCKVGGKCDARTVAIEPLMDAPNVTLKTGHMVVQLETNAVGDTVTGVVCELGEGERVTYSGDIVVLAAGAVNTAVLLQRSRNAAHPNGIANGSDQVGRNYMFHTMTAIMSVTAHHVDAEFPKTLGINDFYWGDPDGSYNKPMGHIQSLEYMEGDMLSGQLKGEIGIAENLVPNFLLDAIAKRMLSFLLLSEDLPLQKNRVLWRDDRVNLHYTYNNLEGHKRLVKRFDAMLDDFCDEKRGFSDHHFQMSQLLPIYGSAHQCGTARMGDDPRRSVVGADGKAHELDNLYIADTSIFCTSAAVNPTLTLVALSLRIAERIKDRLGGGTYTPTVSSDRFASRNAFDKVVSWFRN